MLAAGLAVLTAATVTAFVRTGDPADADTRLASVRGALVVAADGTQSQAHNGDLVPRGATVRTGRGGGARLETSGRDVYVGALSTVTVTDGVRQKLTKGQVMVDTRKGPRLELTTQAGAVRAAEGAMARVERGASLRLAVLAGRASFTAAGRKATSTVPTYYQVRVPYGAVAGRATAMALTPDDRWERDLAADLVLSDTDLNRFAVGLDGADGATVLASLRTGTLPADLPGTARSERALAAALAEAAGHADSLEKVTTARAEGGSWGVVAAIVGAPVTTVSALLDRLLATPTSVGSGPLNAGGLLDLGRLLGGLPGSRTGAGTEPPTSGTPPPTGVVPPVGPPDVPPVVPPVEPPPDPVPGLLDTVLDLLPTPTPTPSPSTAPALPSVPLSPPSLSVPLPTVPLPTVTLPPLLGG